jgi:glycosyltransferase involved in cell wall biosynthesis
MSSPALSVIICTHNPKREYLDRALAGLAEQTMPRNRWELLLVDNASKPPLASWFDSSRLPQPRVIEEEKLGLTHARLRGVGETCGNVIVFVDDDNILASDYLHQAEAISREWPRLGTWGGQTLPDWEVTPPDWTRRYWNWIGVRELERDLWSNLRTDMRSAPFGAGMCVRRAVAETYREVLSRDALRRSLGRTGSQLIGSEDSDLAFTACDLGLGNGIFTRLKLTHLIPQHRIQEDYLLRLVESLTFSNTLLMLAHGVAAPMPSRAQRFLQFYQSLFIERRARLFDNARARGRQKAWQLAGTRQV